MDFGHKEATKVGRLGECHSVQLNVMFVGLPVYLQRRLQAVLNASARLVFGLRRYDHVTDALAILHWLCVPERVNFKLALTAYRVLNGMVPSYLNQLVPVSSLSGRRRLRSRLSHCSCSSRYTVCQQSAVARFRSLPLYSGTLCQMTFSLRLNSVSAFCILLKTFLFHNSFPDVIL